jgi:redox-sensing transcriptional repressor
VAKYAGVSTSVIRRLPRYYRFLGDLLDRGVERISSREFADITGLTASQIRQDLNCFGGFGQQGYGYNVETLHAEIGKILGVDKLRPSILIGAGNLGIAIANHIIFEKRGFRLDAIFDSDRGKTGLKVRDWIVMHTDTLESYCHEHKPLIALLCIPRQAAMESVDCLIEYGIRGFWNFSHYDLSVRYKDKVAVENVHLGDSLMTLSFNVGEVLDD